MGNKVKEILSQILKVPAAAVTDDLAMKDVEAWDFPETYYLCETRPTLEIGEPNE